MPLLHKNHEGLPIGLPENILFRILDDVTPEQAVAAFSVGNHTRKFIGNNAFWKRKFERHFPHRYVKLVKNKNIDWYAEFRKTYRLEYAAFSVDNRLLFSLVKEEDVRSLRAKGITLEVFDKRDVSSFSLLEWAQRTKNQALLDYIYELACASYMAEDQMSVDVLKVDDRDRTIFYWAIACSQPLETITSLLSRGSRLDEIYYVNIKPIHIAVEVDRLDIVQLFLEREPDLLDVTDFSHGTPLYWASMLGHAKIARHLINAGADLTLVSGFMRLQAIHIAALRGQLEAVRVLLEKSPHMLEQMDECGQTPLLWAARCGHADVVAYLIEKGAAIDAPTRVPVNGIDAIGVDTGKTPLYWAADLGHAEVVRLLINAGANTAATILGDEQWHPIHTAADNGHLDVVQALIESRPEFLEQVDACRQTPLLHAARSGRADVVAYLISLGANLNVSTNNLIPDSHGKTPLYWAAENGHNDVVRQLVQAGADVTITVGDKRWQPIHEAIDKDRLAVVRTLIESHPALLEQRDADGSTPLLLALACNFTEIATYLVSQGANLNAATNNGITALDILVADRQHRNINSLIVNAFSDPTTNKGGEKLPAIHAAVRDGKHVVVSMFIDIRPDLVNQKDADGKTPLDWAVAKGYAAIAFDLVKQGAKFGLTKGLTKVIQKTGFGKAIRDKLKLAAYISKRETQPEYKKSFRLFGHTFNFGFSATKKLAAAEALRKVVFNGADRASLAQHKKALHNGDLGAIYRRFRVR